MPIFGIAQGFIPASDLPSRRWVFQLFVAYILASLGLLMTTSLIGLMRYLHGRQVEMPNSLMISWISVGSVVGVALLCLAWLLPRPAPEYSIAKSLPFSFKTPDSTRPNSWALGSDGQKSGVQANSSRRNGQQGQSGQGQSGQGQSGQGSFANGFSQFSLPPALTHVGTLIKILAAIALLTLLTWALLRYRKEILASCREWWSGLTRWWSLFLGRKSRQRRGIDPVSSVAVNPLRPFTTFSNPFRGNLADQLSPDELVAMSFTALESWAQDFGHPRHEDQTPIEFAKSLTCSVPELGPSAQAFTKLVNQSAYAPNTLDRKCLPTVKRLWDQLEKRVPSSSLQHAR